MRFIRIPDKKVAISASVAMLGRRWLAFEKETSDFFVPWAGLGVEELALLESVEGTS